ncbi:hypothetical protein CCR94_03625 [Rhodoblastus sphagnicola]|uniref:Secreted protein n=1 Tax=Rhodoblastus sphagnicola TaxID=333368 RepID=A0A2S6NDQ5_9HYPH|nr:hypothetical protein CCR94_03625 [Rhodoblastus sphagnicola]
MAGMYVVCSCLQVLFLFASEVVETLPPVCRADLWNSSPAPRKLGAESFMARLRALKVACGGAAVAMTNR